MIDPNVLGLPDAQALADYEEWKEAMAEEQAIAEKETEYCMHPHAFIPSEWDD